MQDNRYDVDGLRKRKLDKNGNSSTEYGVGIATAASEPLTGSSAAPSISYIAGHMIMGAEIDGGFVYHLGDALSTVRDVVDDDGDVIRSFEFDEYGNLLSSSGSGTTSPKTWIGGLSVNDDRVDSGLWNMGHRNYAAGVLGRFISRDPIGHAGNMNLYAYPTNPVTFVDPSGLDPVVIYLHTKSSEIAQMNQALGTSFSPETLARQWELRLKSEVGVDVDIRLAEGFNSDSSKYKFDDNCGFHTNLHFTTNRVNSSDGPGLSTPSRGRVSYRVLDELHDERYGSGAAGKSSRLNNALYNSSMHELTHTLGIAGDHPAYTPGFLGVGRSAFDPRGKIMSPKMSVDKSYFEGLMYYGNDQVHKNAIKDKFNFLKSNCK